jgi:hypothetical protein
LSHQLSGKFSNKSKRVCKKEVLGLVYLNNNKQVVVISLALSTLNKFMMTGHFVVLKGQLISKANCQVVNFSKKRMNEFIFTTMRRVVVRFSEEIEDTKKAFRN